MVRLVNRTGRDLKWDKLIKNPRAKMSVKAAADVVDFF